MISIDKMKAHEEDEETGRELNEREKKEKRNAYRKLGAIGKLYNIVVHIHASASRTKEFENMAGRRIPLDNHTRWNS
jgi:hypothetical protein